VTRPNIGTRTLIMAAVIALTASLGATAATAATPPPGTLPSPTATSSPSATPTPTPTTAPTPTPIPAPATTAPKPTATPTPATQAPATTAPAKAPKPATTAKTATKAPAAKTATKSPAAAAAVCKSATAQPSDTFPGTTVVADNFESGNLSKWTVKTGGNGSASIMSNAKVTGACSSRLLATTAAGSIATLTKTIPAGLGEVYVDGYFDVATTAVAGAANAYLRFYSGSTRIASISRNTTGGQLWLGTLSSTGTWNNTRLTSKVVSTGTWHRIQVHILPNGTKSTVQVWLDGVSVYSSAAVNGRTSAITSVSIGNELARQQGALYLDNLLIKAKAQVVPPNCNSALPTDSFPGHVVVADGFECGNLAKWTVNKAGDGAATVQTSPVHSGLYSAKLATSPNNLSLANLSHSIPAASTDVYADGWFDVTAIGPVGNDVPYFRFFTGTTRFADIYRYNSNGQLWLRVLSPAGTDTYVLLAKTSVSLNAWHHVQMRVGAKGAATTIQVWLDGAQVYNSSSVSTSATKTTSVMMGSEHYPQPAGINIDDVVIKAVP